MSERGVLTRLTAPPTVAVPEADWVVGLAADDD